MNDQPEHRLKFDEPELEEIALPVVEALGAERFQKLVNVLEQYDYPLGYMDEHGNLDRSTEHGLYHHLFPELPAYFEAARAAGVDTGDACEFVTSVAESSFHGARRSEVAIRLLGQALEASVAHGQTVEGEDWQALRALMGVAQEKSNSETTADMYRSLQQLGFASAESVDIIQNELRVNTTYMMPVTKFAEVLSVADIEPARVKEVICAVAADGRLRNDILQDLAILTETIATVCPAQDIPPAELLDVALKSTRRGEDLSTELLRVISEDRQLKNKAVVVDPEANIERHFISKSGKLELAALPYCTQRSFEEGLSDLQTIARGKMALYDRVGEGAWVFDEASSMWYSLGGETTLEAESVHHAFQPYDVSALSDSPMVLHCHPREFQDIRGIKRNNGVVPNHMVPLCNRLIVATPSRADYRTLIAQFEDTARPLRDMRAVIAHGEGFTEYDFPLDRERLEYMAQNARDLRADLIHQINWEGLAGIDPQDALGDIIAYYNQQLPEDFQLTLYRPM